MSSVWGTYKGIHKDHRTREWVEEQQKRQSTAESMAATGAFLVARLQPHFRAATLLLPAPRSWPLFPLGPNTRETRGGRNSPETPGTGRRLRQGGELASLPKRRALLQRPPPSNRACCRGPGEEKQLPERPRSRPKEAAGSLLSRGGARPKPAPRTPDALQGGRPSGRDSAARSDPPPPTHGR